VYTFIDDRPVRTLKAKIRALTHRTSQQDLAYVLTRLGQIMRGSPRVVWLLHDVALQRPAESFCNTSRGCGARHRC
jgi:hypothetical protein